jgi:hypothetical protein
MKVEIDYLAAMDSLSEALAGITDQSLDRSVHRKQYEAISGQLAETRAMLSSTSLDIPLKAHFELPGRFQSLLDDVEKVHSLKQGAFDELISEIHRLEKIAADLARDLPTRKRNKDSGRIEYAAELFLFIRFLCGFPHPQDYQSDPAVLDFSVLLTKSGIDREPSACRRYIRNVPVHKYADDYYLKSLLFTCNILKIIKINQ